MKTFARFITLLTLLAAITAGAGSANGSPYSPGLDYGWEGVRAPSGDVRYVTLGTPKSTMVAAISVRGGRVLAFESGSRVLRSSARRLRRDDVRTFGRRAHARPRHLRTASPATRGSRASSPCGPRT